MAQESTRLQDHVEFRLYGPDGKLRYSSEKKVRKTWTVLGLANPLFVLVRRLVGNG